MRTCLRKQVFYILLLCDQHSCVICSGHHDIFGINWSRKCYINRENRQFLYEAVLHFHLHKSCKEHQYGQHIYRPPTFSKDDLSCKDAHDVIFCQCTFSNKSYLDKLGNSNNLGLRLHPRDTHHIYQWIVQIQPF